MHNNLLNTFQEQNWVVAENGTLISKFLLLFYYGFRENVYISELKMKNYKCNTGNFNSRKENIGQIQDGIYLS